MKKNRHGLFKLAKSGVLNRLAGGIFLGLVANAAMAQSNAEGYVYGTAPAGSTITVKSPSTGSSYTLTADGSGKYRVSGLQAGEYIITNSVGGVESAETVTVRLGEGTQARFGADNTGATVLGVVRATASRVKAVDVTSTETSLNIGEKQIDSVPVARDISNVALLAPGTVAGDPGFGNLASFGGSTASENQYFLNGFNISDLRTRLGPADVPFEFFSEFQVKTGGYGAEFGRSTGGVVNATSKRGTNTWEFGASAYYQPNSLRGTKPNTRTFDNVGGTQTDDTPRFVYEHDEYTEKNYDFNLGGPIIKDRLFVFALANFTQIERNETYATVNPLSANYRRGPRYREREYENPFGAIKIDWQIADGHKFEYTGFSDKSIESRTIYPYDLLNNAIDYTSGGVAEIERGGQTSIYRYIGNITSDFKVSALYGRGTTALSQFPPQDNLNCPQIVDARTPGVNIGCWVANPLINTDKRKAYRLDFEYNLGDFLVGSHLVRFGADQEKNTSTNISSRAGGGSFTVDDFQAGQSFTTASNLSAPSDGTYVEVQRFVAGGTFKENLDAFYIEDEWRLGSVTMNLGARRETFQNKFPDGSTYVDLKSAVAPRLGISWDVFGDGNSKLFASYGDYYIPLGTQAAVRNGGGELNTVEVYEFNGYGPGPEQVPQLGAQVGSQTFSDGTNSDPATLVNPNAKPSYQTEYVVGFETLLPEEYFGSKASGGIRFIHRDLKRTLEDSAVDAGLNAVLGDPNFAHGFDYYFLTNPGEDATIAVDTDGDGTLETINIPASVLGYVPPKRKYYAVELTYEKSFSKKWFLSSSYTWSQSYGNYEGFINSDIEQSDVGITQDFDQPGLSDNAYGFLPNDRRHKFKLFGSYRPTEEWNLGANLQAYSGRPYSARGIHPTDAFARAYGAFSFFQGGQPAYRGEAGKTPFVTTLDLNVKYKPTFLQSKATFGVDVFNVLDSEKATEVYERADTSRNSSGVYTANPSFGAATNYQAPRAVRFTAEVSF